MLILWITINWADLDYLFIIYLVKVKFDLRSYITLIFVSKIATINLVAVAKFFYIIYKVILLSLFTSQYLNRSLLGLVWTYYKTVKINTYSMLYLHYSV